ncbi:MAG: hypothetical protein ACI9JN_002287 [Bacteroidia bacterium]|jgi:hypothetical protein
MTDFFQKQLTSSLPFKVLMVLTVVLSSSCNVFDREEQIPVYFFIDQFELETKSDNSQGSNAHDIQDAWVYVDGQLVGVFEVPVTIPVLAQDTAKITILAGIKKNGLSNDREIYPFYKAIQDTLILVPGSIDSFFPKIKYHDSTEFIWIEDFEDRTISFEPSGIDIEEDSMQLTLEPTEVFNHSNLNQVSSFVEFDSINQAFENATISKFKIAANASTYLEMNYNLEAGTQVGFYVYDAAGIQIKRINVLFLFPTEGKWKKSYVSLNEDLSDPRFAGGSFRVFFYSYNSSVNNKPKARIYFDNLKLLHF